jgi:hypothetical protein
MLAMGIACTWALVHQGPILLRSAPPDLVSTSPQGRWTLEIHALAGWLYGPHNTRVLAHRHESPWWRCLPGQFLALEFPLRNDGANITSANFAADWITSDSVQIYAHGHEQADTTYLIDLEAARTTAIGTRFSLFASLWMLLILATMLLEAVVLLFTASPPSEASPTEDQPNP